MISISLLFVLLGLLRWAHSLPNVPSRTQARGLHAPVAPAFPTITLASDFKKGNVSAHWAEGYPKYWGAEEKTYEMPVPLGQSLFDASLSPDGRFLVLSNSSDTRIIKLDTGTIVSTPGRSSTGDNRIVELRSTPEGQYDLIISPRDYYNTKIHITTQIRLSADGIPINQPIERTGDFSPVDATHFSKDGRRMLTQLEAVVHAYDLDNVTSGLTLSGHTDRVVSEAFSADGKYIATTAVDTWTKIWDAHSGILVQDIGPSDYQNALTLFSPDSKFLLVSSREPAPAVKLWSIENIPVEIAPLGQIYKTIEKAAWSPNGEYLALCDISEKIQILRMSDLEVVQEWKQGDGYQPEIEELTWLEDGKKLAYRVMGGLEMYDFEKNLKYRWSAGDYDHYTSAGRKIFVLESKKWIGGVDGDQKVRFWLYPV